MFAPPFKPSQPSKQAKEHLHSRTKKRKRGSDDESAGVLRSAAEIDQNISSSGQLRDSDSAGPSLPSHDELGDKNYSSRSYGEGLSQGNSNSVRSRPSDLTGLRKQHLAVLIAVLHRCLFAGDYLRAGRAWGMLLRAESQGHAMDLRTYGRWGIGAEILLFRDTQLTQRQQPAIDEEDKTVDQSTADRGKTTQKSSPLLSHEGFGKAKDYYERLVLQYPHRRTMPNATSSLDFYPAMFGLWVYAVQYKYNNMLSGFKAKPPEIGLDGTNTNEEVRVRHATFRSASEIAAHLDELLVSPPYSDSLRLWRLRGMIALWMADLLQPDDPADFGSESEDSSISYWLSMDNQDLEQYRSDQDSRRQQRLEAKGQAHEAFQNVLRLGAVPYIAARQADRT